MNGKDLVRNITYNPIENRFYLRRITSQWNPEPEKVSPKSLNFKIESGQIIPRMDSNAWIAHKIYEGKKSRGKGVVVYA